MLIQVLLVIVIVVGGAVLLRSQSDHRNQAIRRLLVLGVAVLAVISVTAPALVTRVGEVLGVGRGTDLLLYALAVTFFGYTVTSYRRNRQLEEQLTVLARSIALAEQRHPDDP